MNISKLLTTQDIVKSFLIATLLFIILGTVTGLWTNPFFARMSSITAADFIILGLESLLLGFYLGIQTSKTCSPKKAGAGGTLGFLGFACPVCNKLLVILFGSGLLLNYFEPIRVYVGFFGIGILILALYQKLQTRVITTKSTSQLE